MSDSPISPTNLDDFLFLDDVLYFDLRLACAVSGGRLGRRLCQHSVLRRAGRLSARGQCPLPHDEGPRRKRKRDCPDRATSAAFSPITNNRKAQSAICSPRISRSSSSRRLESKRRTRSVCWSKLGYDGSFLYNAGTFSNGMGGIIAYKDYPDAKYHVPGTNVYTVVSEFRWNETLTPTADE